VSNTTTTPEIQSAIRDLNAYFRQLRERRERGEVDDRPVTNADDPDHWNEAEGGNQL